MVNAIKYAITITTALVRVIYTRTDAFVAGIGKEVAIGLRALYNSAT